MPSAQTAAAKTRAAGHDGSAQCDIRGLQGQKPSHLVQYRRRTTLPEAQEWTKRFRRKSCVGNQGICVPQITVWQRVL
jgi:hypothetical protein